MASQSENRLVSFPCPSSPQSTTVVSHPSLPMSHLLDHDISEGPYVLSDCLHLPCDHHLHTHQQGWRTFLTNHVDGIAAIDLFVLPTITFRLLYCLVILRHGRRLWVSFGVTTNPTAEWISRQITEAFPWDSSPHYLIRDRDTAY